MRLSPGLRQAYRSRSASHNGAAGCRTAPVNWRSAACATPPGVRGVVEAVIAGAVRSPDRRSKENAARRRRLLARRCDRSVAANVDSTLRLDDRSPAASGSTVASSSSDASRRSIACKVSSAARRIRVTPWVLRPTCEISAARVRTSVPPSEISSTSWWSVSWIAPTSWPLRSVVLQRDHALGAAALARVIVDRGALAVAALAGGEDVAVAFDHDQAAAPPRPRPGACRARRWRCGPSSGLRSRRSARPCRCWRTA